MRARVQQRRDQIETDLMLIAFDRLVRRLCFRTDALQCLLFRRCPWPFYFGASNALIFQKAEILGRCCLMTLLPNVYIEGHFF